MPLWSEKGLMLCAKKQPSSWTSHKDLFPLPLFFLHTGCVVFWSSATVGLGWYNGKLLLQFAHLSGQLFKLVLHTFEVSFQCRLHTHLFKFNSVWRDKQKPRERVSCSPGRQVEWSRDSIPGLMGRLSEVTDWPAGWLTDWLTDWLTGWLTD